MSVAFLFNTGQPLGVVACIVTAQTPVRSVTTRHGKISVAFLIRPERSEATLAPARSAGESKDICAKALRLRTISSAQRDQTF